jgi:peptidylprolyl isomerase
MGMHREVKIEYKKLKEKVKEYNKKDAKFYSNMLSKMLEPHKGTQKEAQAMSIDTKA